MKLRQHIQFFLGSSIFLDLLYIYGIAGSLETDFISMRQAMIKELIACTYMTIAAIISKRFIRVKSTGCKKREVKSKSNLMVGEVIARVNVPTYMEERI